jgi:hypothetical protein
MDAIQAEWQALCEQRRALDQEQAILDEQIRTLDKKMADCQAAARLFGGGELADAAPEAGNGLWSRLLPFGHNAPPHTNDARPADARDIPDMEFPDIQPLPDDALARSGDEMRHDQDDGLAGPNDALQRALLALSGRPVMPRIRDIVLDRLKEAGESGSKAAPIQAFIQATYGQAIHDKTVGMTLYRLQRENLVRREGHIWFYAVQDATALTSNAVSMPHHDGVRPHSTDGHANTSGRMDLKDR